MLARIAETGALMFGTHFSGQPTGRLVESGDAWRFEPVAARS
jgi:hypothetical protein